MQILAQAKLLNVVKQQSLLHVHLPFVFNGFKRNTPQEL